MRRDLRTCLAALLAAWIPVDSVFAGWWHHHHRGPVVIVGGPVPMAPCGPPAPWAGWGHAIVIDDRPLVAPVPATFVVAAPVVEVVVHPIVPVVVEEHVHEEVIVAGYDTADAVVDVCTCDSNDIGIVSEGATPIVADVWTTDVVPAATVESANASVVTDRPEPVETRPEAPLPPPTEPLPTEQAPPVAPPVTAERPPAESAPSVLEPGEPVTLQGETAAPIEETFGETIEERDGFEGPDDDGDDVAGDEPMDDGDAMLDDGDDADVTSEPAAPATGGARNLFDEVPADDFGAPASDDDAIPDAPPMEEGFEPPTDEAPLDDMPVDDMPMEEAHDDEGFESPADDDIPMDDDDAQTEETPVDEEPAADPFDSSLRVPAAPTRTWQDDTGRFSTEGRLVEIRAGSVRILKANGRHTTVPMERLSAGDRDHVAGVRRAIVASRPGRGDTAAIR